MIKKLANYKGYSICSDGVVYSHKTHKIMKLSKNHKGYLQVCLTLDGKKVTKRVHRLVAESFIPNPKGLPQVNHIDGDKTNNDISNLEWCDNSQNQKHAYRVLGREGHGGGGGKTPVICTDTGEQFNSISDAARKTGIQITNISRTCKGRTKHAGGLKWAYVEGGRSYVSNS